MFAPRRQGQAHTNQTNDHTKNMKTKDVSLRAYHFTGDTLRNGEPIPPIGKWLIHKGEINPCASGLHASEHPFDALTYAPGPILHLVELAGPMKSHGDPIDKWVAQKRKIIASVDATELLLVRFPAICAFSC